MAAPELTTAGFDALYGLEIQRASADGMRGRIAIDERHLQPFGLVHGGVYAAMAESLASYGTALGAGDGMFVAGLSNNTSFLRPVFKGDTITGVAIPKHRGRMTWVWEVEVTTSSGKPCALVRVTIAVRPAEDPRGPTPRSGS
jgi:uncharacterized protein (TIGR00369 family)